MEHIYDTVIIGGGPSGYTAALYCARAGLDTVVLERMYAGGQMALSDKIDNYPGYEAGINGITLGQKMKEGAERFGAKTECCGVTEVSFSEKIKRVNATNGVYLCKTVIICTGADARMLEIEGESDLIGRGVHYCAHCDGRFYKDKTVAVIGGGNSAVEDALYLKNMAKKVYIIHRRDSLRCSKIYKDMLKNAKNIDFIWNSTVSEFIADGILKGINVKNINDLRERSIVLDGVFVSIGRKPATEFLNGAVQTDENGYIVADETTKTNVPGVYAAGDVRTKILRQVITAAADGASAAYHAEQYILRT